ncbi:unnamed protein product [Adineta steineri]|uniref:G domain-containing protein n=1 Tax=Adineta steineri TaxID=433720 RepID=A0A815MHY0_9BILA|nr:unnamed protein product [Adineta steineri]CAF1424681.1 unnamed protein product [Adineta steineri]
MVLPFVIGCGLALSATFVLWKGSKKIDDIRHDVKDTVKTAADIATDVRLDALNIVTRFALTIGHIAHNLTKNMDELTYGCLESLTMLTNRIDTSIRKTVMMDANKPLIQQQLIPKRLTYKPCAVVMGRTGAGKTTLINSLCRTQHAAGEGAGSVTRNLFRNDVRYGENTFSLIDTPGTDSSTETYKHAFLLREALTATKINTIFIVIKYDNRFDKMIENYFEVEQPVYNYSKKIIVMISHWDQSKNPQNTYKEICELFQDECTNVANLIFYSEQNFKTEVANLMYSCMSNMNEEKLHIKDEDFFLRFNIYEMKSRIKVSFGQYKKKANLLVQEYTDLINSVRSESVEDKDEALHMTIVKFRDEMETLLQDFQQQHVGTMEELDYYAFSIKMEKENLENCDKFVEKVVPLMSYSLTDNQDPRNLIKRCPHCKLIWFKTEGCDGLTTCGNNKFSRPKDVSDKAFWKYQLERIGGKLQFVKNSTDKNIFKEMTNDAEEDFEENVQKHFDTDIQNVEPNLEELAVLRERPMKQLKQMFRSFFVDITEQSTENINELVGRNSKGVGCGKEFKWSALPKIEDDLILELFKVKTIDQAKQLIQAGNFKEARHNYEYSIDQTFYF